MLRKEFFKNKHTSEQREIKMHRKHVFFEKNLKIWTICNVYRTLVRSKGLKVHRSACSKVMTWSLAVQVGKLPSAMALYKSLNRGKFLGRFFAVVLFGSSLPHIPVSCASDKKGSLLPLSHLICVKTPEPNISCCYLKGLSYEIDFENVDENWKILA